MSFKEIQRGAVEDFSAGQRGDAQGTPAFGGTAGWDRTQEKEGTQHFSYGPVSTQHKRQFLRFIKYFGGIKKRHVDIALRSTWFIGGLGSVMFTAGLKSLSHPKFTLG